MNRSIVFAATLLSVAAPIQALPPPAPPPLSPQVEAASEALVAALPFEEALARRNYLQSDGIIAIRVTDHLVNSLDRRRRLGCNRDYVRDYLVPRVAGRLPDMLPEVARRLRVHLASEIGYSMSLEELVAGRAILETVSGRALVLNTWGSELPLNELVAAIFTNAISGEFETLLGYAVSDCRRWGRPPEPPL